MNAKVKGIIFGAAALVILVGAVVALKLTETKEPEIDAPEESVTSKLAYEKKAEDISSITLKTADGTLKILGSGADRKIEGLDNVPLDTAALAGVDNAVSKVTTRDTVEENGDLAKFGLNKPRLEVKVEFNDSDKTVKEFMLGNENAANTTQSYFKFKDDSAVYIVTNSEFSPLFAKSDDLIQKTILSKPVDGEDVLVEELIVRRKDLPYNLSIIVDPDAEEKTTVTVAASHIISSPVSAELNMTKANPVIEGLYALTATSVVKVNPTDEDLAGAGIFLSDDNATLENGTLKSTMNVSMKVDGKTYLLTVGNQIANSTTVYGYFNDINILYAFDKSTLPWLTLMPTDIISDSLINIGIYEAKKVDVTVGEKTISFASTGEEAETFTVKQDGNDIDKDYYKTFYQFLLRCTPDEVSVTEPTKAVPDAKVTLTKRSGKTETYEFFIDGRKAVVKKNGKASFTTKSTYVTRLAENIKLLETGGEIIQTW